MDKNQGLIYFVAITGLISLIDLWIIIEGSGCSDFETWMILGFLIPPVMLLLALANHWKIDLLGAFRKREKQ
jgi:hypothetical protein